VRGDRAIGLAALAIVAATTLAVGGCGGGTRQDAKEPSGRFTVEVPTHRFPAKQRLAERVDLTIAVRNADTRALPNVAVTVDSFDKASTQVGLADPARAVWLVDAPPRNSQSAYTNTWSLGSLAPGQTRMFRWGLTPVQPGTYVVKYRVAAALNGKAQAQLAGGDAPEGSFTVRITPRPSQATVGEDGKVVRSP